MNCDRADNNVLFQSSNIVGIILFTFVPNQKEFQCGNENCIVNEHPPPRKKSYRVTHIREYIYIYIYKTLLAKVQPVLNRGFKCTVDLSGQHSSVSLKICHFCTFYTPPPKKKTTPTGVNPVLLENTVHPFGFRSLIP